MIKEVFSILDVTTNEFNAPFLTVNKAEALRHLGALKLDDKSLVACFPNDFVLYHLGTFDNMTGVYSTLSVPVKVVDTKDIAIEV